MFSTLRSSFTPICRTRPALSIFKMAANTTRQLSSTSLLFKDAQPQPYSSMQGKLHHSLLDGLRNMGYQNMSAVQQKVLTEMPSFGSDCLVQAKTGTGKTIAFLLPILHRLLTETPLLPKGYVGALIVSPTRELALQIAKELEQVTSRMHRPVTCQTAFGGTNRNTHLRAFLENTPQVLVATPGRLDDFLGEGDVVTEKFGQIRAVVLDEADRMLDSGFLPNVQKILRSLPPKSSGWQGMCFSATMPDKVKQVLSNVLRPGYTHLTTIDPNETPTIEAIDQFSVVVRNQHDVLPHLSALIDQEKKQNAAQKIIVFGSTANGVGFLYDLYSAMAASGGLKVYELHSRLSQNTRTKTTEEFKKTTSGILFASDVIGRGMDFPNVNLVIQVGLPANAEQYVHRVGRTARAGTSGRAVILLTEREKDFVTYNRALPINKYTVTLTDAAESCRPAITRALSTIDEETIRKAYQAFLGFNKDMKLLRLDKTALVALANEYAAAIGSPEPPLIDKVVVGKMGLRGTPGLNVGHIERAPRDAPGPKKNAGNASSGSGGAPPVQRQQQGFPPAGGRQRQPAVSRPGQPGGQRRGIGSGRKGGRTKQHQGPPGGGDTTMSGF